MTTLDDVARIALALPGVTNEGWTYRVNGKQLAWPWLERVHPKRPRVPNPEVLVVQVANEARKFELVATEPEIFFTEPHYNGYAAVMLRLPVTPPERLEQALQEAWSARSAQPKRGRRASRP